ncbi:MAG: DUF2852 domain-containing protein [Alphaproteobacteria bacterium]|nr:DUF2852 domain-containing protein [Alphaproteobacteria bacterium]
MNTAIIKPQWSPISIALMVLGFVIFWPLGLAVLAYILWGEYLGGSRERATSWMERQKKSMGKYRNKNRFYRQSSGNRAFDDYREAELKRLDEERRRLEEEREEFSEYLRNLHLARDREEFDRFKSDRAARRHNDPNGDHSDNNDEGDRPNPN